MTTPINLDELERLFAARIPETLPWDKAACSHGGALLVRGTHSQQLYPESDVDLLVAMGRTLPALLAIARAAVAWRDAIDNPLLPSSELVATREALRKALEGITR